MIWWLFKRFNAIIQCLTSFWWSCSESRGIRQSEVYLRIVEYTSITIKLASINFWYLCWTIFLFSEDLLVKHMFAFVNNASDEII